ncbi:hypothetical protein EZV73_11380 [Acidaminobacter sp. JC074]|uniref:pilus assembly protein PilM n=1 Tax=Acidaminobacter sp. JC074 TaxID=2530199 RepID=UPI001F10678F|nr:hypothetical protein [Acidaminobacter sp. JC074]
MAKKIGVDIGKDTIKIALVRDGKKPGLLWHHSYKIPEGMFQGELMIDHETLKASIFDVLLQHKIKSGSISCVVNDSQSTYDSFVYDGVKKKDIKTMLELELNQKVSGDLTDYEISHYLSSMKKGTVKGIVSSSRTELVDDLVKVFESKKYKLNVIDHPMNAFMKSLKAWGGNRMSTTSYVVLNIGVNTTQVYVINSLELMTNRVIGIGSRDLDFQISGTLNCTMDEAREIKESGFHKAAESGVKIQTVIDSTFSSMFMEVEQMIDDCKEQGKLTDLHGVYMMGNGSKITGIETLLKDVFGVKVQYLGPTDFNLPYTRDIQECLIAAGACIGRRK